MDETDGTATKKTLSELNWEPRRAIKCAEVQVPEDTEKSRFNAGTTG